MLDLIHYLTVKLMSIVLHTCLLSSTQCVLTTYSSLEIIIITTFMNCVLTTYSSLEIIIIKTFMNCVLTTYSSLEIIIIKTFMNESAY